jgi:hypothetical protein
MNCHPLLSMNCHPFVADERPREAPNLSVEGMSTVPQFKDVNSCRKSGRSRCANGAPLSSYAEPLAEAQIEILAIASKAAAAGRKGAIMVQTDRSVDASDVIPTHSEVLPRRESADERG